VKDLENLTQKEKDLISSLVNPDDQQGKTYKWDFRYQQEILGMLMTDRVFLIQSMQLVKPSYFSDKVHETICSIVFNYFEKYNQIPPKYVIANEIREKYEDDKKVLIYVGEMEAITSNYVSGLEPRESCLDKITEFAKEQALRSAVSSTLDLLEKGYKDKWNKIEELFKKALLTDRNFDMGLDYFQTLEDRYDRMAKQNLDKEVFVTGFRGIDVDGLSAGGICRGELAAFLGSSGAGKSLLLVKASARNILRGKKVLYISLEMDEDKLAKRFDAILSNDNIRTLLDRKDFVLSALKDHIKGEEDKRRLIIKQFPAGTVDVQTIKAYLSQLNLHGWQPDMICVDYVGEFKDEEGIKTYESRQRIVRDMRGMAVEYNVAIFTAMQANRRSKEDTDNMMVVDDSMLGDSFGQARPLDALWSINQNPEEKSQNVGRIFVVKHRDGKSRYILYFRQDKNTLEPQEISHDTYVNIRSQLRVQKADLTEMPVFAGKKQFRANQE
jgi:replicative DNA helicase